MVGVTARSIEELLFPGVGGVVVEDFTADDRLVVVRAFSRTLQRSCFACGVRASRVHSRYERRISDRPVAGRSTVILLTVRRFFCDNAECERRTFVEQIAGISERYRQASTGLRELLHAIALARSSDKTVTEVARDLGVSPEGLRGWVKQDAIDRGQGSSGALTSAEREELGRLRRRNRELEQTVIIRIRHSISVDSAHRWRAFIHSWTAVRFGRCRLPGTRSRPDPQGLGSSAGGLRPAVCWLVLDRPASDCQSVRRQLGGPHTEPVAVSGLDSGCGWEYARASGNGTR
ncbi:transposase family protein [Streptomyces sp. NBC_00154]|uniref:transposase family protein n=1 Tax=Streptomyces sp. NBC_00154 TaxID=2975670 RepID=UPI00338E22E5